MGGMIGGTFGAAFGTFYAIQNRTFWLMPMSAISSGVTFGFFMGLGMTFRMSGM